MPPKLDPNRTFEINIRTKTGGIASIATLAPKVGPLGFSPKRVAEDLEQLTKDFINKGQRIHVKMIVTGRAYKLEIKYTAALLVIKALNDMGRGSGDPHRGNINLTDVFQIARVIRPKSFAKTLEGTIKEVLGTVKSVGAITVDGEDPVEISKKIDLGEIAVPTE